METQNAKWQNVAGRLAKTLAILITFLMIWANLGVGLIGSGPNLGNLLYIGVVAVFLIGSIYTRFKMKQMEWVMYLTAFSLLLHSIICFLTGMQHEPGSSPMEILAVNGTFTNLYFISAFLFRLVKL